MCEKAQPYFLGLVEVDLSFDEDEDEVRRHRIYEELVRNAQKKKDFEKARKISGISINDSGEYFFEGKPLQPQKNERR